MLTSLKTMKTDMLKRWVLSAALMLLGSTAFGQSYMLMAVSGDVQYGSEGSWKKATTGARLAGTDKLKLGDRAYAAVVINNTRTFELKKTGTYSLSELNTGAKAGGSVTSRYVDYVVNRSTSNKLGNNMSNLGAVERSMAPLQLSPRNASLAEENARFVWAKQPGAPGYIFVMTDIDGEELFRTTVEDTFVVVNLAQYNLKANECYYWKVANKRMPGMASDDLCFRLMGADQRTSVANAVREIKEEVGTDETAVNWMVLASYYQDQQVNDKAMEAYERAIALAPEVKEYRLMYAEFLMKLGLAARAKQMADSAAQ